MQVAKAHRLIQIAKSSARHIQSPCPSMEIKAMECKLLTSKNSVETNNDLEISFRRTVRVPDNQQVSALPPDLDTFPLEPISKYATKLNPSMAAKGGLFFPMYQSEATWINFKTFSFRKCMIKIYAGGVNDVS